MHLLVEGNWGAEKGVDDIGVVVQLLVHHEGEDAHLGGTAVVELDGKLLVDGLLVPSRGVELSSFDVIFACGEAKLDEADESNDLGSAGGWDGVKGGKAVLYGGEWDAVSDVSRKADTGGGHQVAKDGKHGNAAVLGLDSAEAIESLLVSVLEEAQWIPEAKRSLSAQSVLEGHL